MKSREKKAQIQEKQRQTIQQAAEAKKLLAQGLVTKEDLQRMAEEKKAELERKREEERAAKNPVLESEENSGGKDNNSFETEYISAKYTFIRLGIKKAQIPRIRV